MSKRLLACMVLTALLVSVLPVAALAETYATVISDDVLHLRLNTGYRYWVRVRTPDKQVGYMYKQYLSSFTRTGSGSGSTAAVRSSSGSTVSLGTGFRYVVTGLGPVNFRKDANVNSRLLDQLQGGTIVWVINAGDTWSSVRYNGTLGWIKTKYLTKSLK